MLVETPGVSFLVKDDDHKVLGHADTLRDLETEQERGGRLYPYLYPLPTVVLQASMLVKVGKAVEIALNVNKEDHEPLGPPPLHPAQRGRSERRALGIMECLATDSLDNSASLQQMGGLQKQIRRGLHPNPLHSEAAYRAKVKVGDHYDAHNAGKKEEARRLLLWAQCQQGKTGAYLHFVHLIYQDKSLLEEVAPRVQGCDMPTLPYWRSIALQKGPFARLCKYYNKPSFGQYHGRVASHRFKLLEESSASGDAWLEEYKALLQRREGVETREGRALLARLTLPAGLTECPVTTEALADDAAKVA
jgi:hypothetical protein